MQINQDSVYVVLINYVNSEQMFIDYRLVGIYAGLSKAEAAEKDFAKLYNDFEPVSTLGLLPCNPTWDMLDRSIDRFTTILKQPLQ